jgi:L-threonylcarbamoyladenylate synthase
MAARLATRFWPGPLTMVLRKAAVLPDLVTAGMDTVGLRVPAHDVALELIAAAGVPIAAPSANRFSEVSPTTAQHVMASLGERVQMILDGGATQVGIESTVVSLRRDPPAVLRPGMISYEDLQAAAGVAVDREVDLPHISESPGLQKRHYAPKTPLHILYEGTSRPAGKGRVLDLPSDAPSYAERLYSALHEADAQGWDWIGIQAPPETERWAGIWDRLRRASAERSGD